MHRIQLATVIRRLCFLPGFAAQAGSQQRTSVPLPDDDPARTARASEKPQAKPHQQAPAADSGDDAKIVPDSAWKQTTTIKGVKVDFRVTPSLKDVIVQHGPVPVNLNDLTSDELFEGQQVFVQFRFKDATGTLLSGLNVAAWLDENHSGKPADNKLCHDKIQSFLQMLL